MAVRPTDSPITVMKVLTKACNQIHDMQADSTWLPALKIWIVSLLIVTLFGPRTMCWKEPPSGRPLSLDTFIWDGGFKRKLIIWVWACLMGFLFFKKL